MLSVHALSLWGSFSSLSGAVLADINSMMTVPALSLSGAVLADLTPCCLFMLSLSGAVLALSLGQF